MDAIDLIDVVGGFKKGTGCSLNEIANLCGIPGKLDTTGDDVAGLFYGGKRREIVEYNAFDAITTYLLWLRVEHFKGTFGVTQYAEEQQRVRDFLVEKSAEPDCAFLTRYVEAWDALQSAEYGIM
jgi:predicted PolB exonuclease-like 3'-5' exonuclease